MPTLTQTCTGQILLCPSQSSCSSPSEIYMHGYFGNLFGNIIPAANQPPDESNAKIFSQNIYGDQGFKIDLSADTKRVLYPIIKRFSSI
jgi:hypothetical protein